MRQPGSGRARRGTDPAATGYLFVAPFMLVFAAMLVLPLAYAAYLSLFQDRLIGGTVFAGLDNYVTALQDDRLLQGVLRVAKFFAFQVPIMLPSRCSRHSPSTAACCGSRRRSGSGSSCRTPFRAWSPR